MPRSEYQLDTVAPQARDVVPANTYIEHYADPSAGKDLMDFADALQGLGAKLQTSQAKSQAQLDDEYKNNLDYYANQFMADKGNGLVDATQVGKAMPGASPIVTGKVTELIGQNYGNQWARSQIDQFLSDDANRDDPAKQRAFFTGLRQQMSQQVQGNPFYGQGAVSAVDSVINEYQSQLEQGAAKYAQDLQEQDFGSQVAAAAQGQPVQFEGSDLDPSTTPAPLMDLIGQHESNGNYDAYSGHANNKSVPVTGMTVNQVIAYQQHLIATGQTPSSAMGKYQIILPTMRSLVKDLGLTGNEQFTPQLQDKMAMALLNRRGYQAFKAGKMSAQEFQNNLAQEWASLPTTSGKGYYPGQSATASTGDLQRAMVSTGPTVSKIMTVDQLAGATSSMNPIRRRQIILDTLTNLAVANRDTSYLDKMPQGMVTPDVAAKLAQVRNQVNSLSWDDYTHQQTVAENDQKAAILKGKQDILQKVAQGQDINIGDYVDQPDVYDFAKQVQSDSLVPPQVSTANAQQLQQLLLGWGTSGVPTDIAGANDVEKMQNTIMGSKGISAPDKQKLLDSVPTLLEGVNLINDPQTQTYFENYVGYGLNAYLSSPIGSTSKLVGENVAGKARQIFDDAVTGGVQDSIEDGSGVPRGKAKRDIYKAAADEANAWLSNIIKMGSAGQAGDAPTTYSAPTAPADPAASGSGVPDDVSNLLNKYGKKE